MKVMNTEEHGVPQHRKRVYIVAIRKDVSKRTMAWPVAIPSAELGRLLDKEVGQQSDIDNLSATAKGNIHRLSGEKEKCLKTRISLKIGIVVGWFGE